MSHFEDLLQMLEARGHILEELARTCAKISEALGGKKEKDHGTF